ncbi:hypothetical protein KY349_03520 [Candidatus Woesearchaeota archaeon]|nr:hypothetical protein [Candidatus Woesearchaeota archaeon]
MPDDKEDTDMGVVRKARSQLKSERESLNNLIGLLNTIEEEMNQREQNIEQKAKELEGLNSELATYDAQVDQTTEEIQRCENTIELSQEKLEKKNHGMIDVEGDIKDAIANLEKKQEETEQSKTAYSAKKDAERKKKQEEIEEKDDDIAAKEFEINALTRQIQALEKEKENLQTEIGVLDKNKQEYQSEIAEIDEDENNHLKECDAHYAAEQEKAREKLSTLEQEKGNIEDIIHNLKNVLTTEHEKRSEMNIQLSQYKQERSDVRKQVDQKEEELEQLRQELEARSVLERVKAASRSSTELYETPDETKIDLEELTPAPEEPGPDKAEDLPDADMREAEMIIGLKNHGLSETQGLAKPIDLTEHLKMGLDVDNVTDCDLDNMLDEAFEGGDMEIAEGYEDLPIEAAQVEAAAAQVDPRQELEPDKAAALVATLVAKQNGAAKRAEEEHVDTLDPLEEGFEYAGDEDIRLIESPLEEVIEGKWKYQSERGISKGVLYCRPDKQKEFTVMKIEYLDSMSMISVLRSSAYHMLDIAQKEFNDDTVMLDSKKIEQLSRNSEHFRSSYNIFTQTVKTFVEGYNNSMNDVISLYIEKGKDIPQDKIDSADIESGKGVVSHPELIRKLKDTVLPGILSRHNMKSMFSKELQGVDAELELLDVIHLNDVIDRLDETMKYLSFYQTTKEMKDCIEGIEYLLDKRGYVAAAAQN